MNNNAIVTDRDFHLKFFQNICNAVVIDYDINLKKIFNAPVSDYGITVHILV